MRKKKFNLLVPLSKCCLKKFYDLEKISKYGSITVISIIMFYQVFNIFIGNNIGISLFSFFINLFFLIIILRKLGMIKISLFDKKLTLILKFIIVVLILNSFGYLFSSEELHKYFFAPISFLGAYFVLLLIIL